MPRTKRPKPAPGLTEKQVTAGVIDAARLFGIALERRNVGAMVNPSGRPVRFGRTGDPDWEATVSAGPNRGRRLAVEAKRSDFDPRRPKDPEHWGRQLAAIGAINRDGGIAFWVRDPLDAARVFRAIATYPGLRVEVDADGFCWLTDEPEGA